MTRCTGMMASWCPVHGDCTCPRDGDGAIEWHYEGGFVLIADGSTKIGGWSETALTVTHYDAACPIHSNASDHAT